MENRIRLLLRGCLLAAAVVFIPFAVSAQTSNVQPRITGAISESEMTTLRGNTNPLAQARFDRGAAPDSLPMKRMLLVLNRSAAQEAGLDALLAQQQDKSSPNYHEWLTPQQFGQQFGPADADIQTIVAWLQSQGFTVNGVSNGRTVIEFSGTAGQVRDAFHTQIHQYNVNGENHWANASDPEIPTALAPVVAGIDSLYNFPRHSMHHIGGIVSRTGNAGQLRPQKPLFTLGGTCGVPGVGCYGVSPYDFATIYDVLPLWNASPAVDGTGETIAIVAESDIAPTDISSFRTYFGLPANNPTIIVNGPDPGTVPGDETESDLDVEWSGAVAKGATIDVVTSQSTEASLGVDLSAEYIVDNNLAPILSESYGICELFLGSAGNQFYNQLWQQASAQGITVLIAAGDSGSAVCDRNADTAGAAQFGLSVSGTSSTPYNVAVGGTDFFDLTNPTMYWRATNAVPPGAPAGTPATLSALSYIPETTWNDSCTNAVFGTLLGFSTNAETNCNNSQLISAGFVNTTAGSGGKSGCTTYDGTNPSSCTGGYAKPSWQTGTGVPSDGKRDVPDVSLFAATNSPSGAFYVICEADQLPAGDTSCLSTDPNTNFLGVGGTSASAPAFAGIMALVDQKAGSRQGNANYVLYKLAAQQPAAFHDVPTGGTIAMPCVTGSLNCVTSTAGDANGVLSGYSTTTGYDLATGLGSVDANKLVTGWASADTALTPSSTTLTLNSGNAVNITHGQSVPVSIGVTGTGGTPTGTVSLIANTGADGTEGVQSFALTSGAASGSTNALPGGKYMVVAQYPGDSTFGASTSPATSVTVAPENSQIQFNLELYDFNTGALVSQNVTTASFGAPTILRVNVTSQAGDTCVNNASGATGCPTGNVTLTDNGSPVGSGTFALNDSGYFESESYGFTLTGGIHQLTATYGGDTSFNAASPTTDTLTITPASTSTSLTFLTGTYAFAAPTTMTVRVASQNLITSIAQTGTVKVFAGSTLLASGTVSGTATPFVNPVAAGFSMTVTLPHGQNTFTAQYGGDGNYAASTSVAQTITVYYPTQVTLTLPSPLVAGSATLTANVTGIQAGTPITGTMQFVTAADVVLCSNVPVSGSGQGTCTATLAAGNPGFQVEYSGDANYAPSQSNLIFQTVAGPTFMMTANPTAVAVSAPGQAGATMLTFTGQNGFNSNGAVMVTPVCAGLPAETTCSSGTSITIPTNGTATATVTFQTTAPSAAMPSFRNPRGMAGGRVAPTILAIQCLLYAATLLIGHRQKQRRWRLAPMLAVCGLIAASVAGCGGGSGGNNSGGGGTQNPGTPTGQYSVSVSVTINGVTQTVSGLTLNVQ